MINLASLQHAIGERLAASLIVTAQLGDHDGRVLAATDPNAQMPFLTFGEDDVRDDSVGGLQAKDVRIAIHIWTREQGFSNCKAIDAAIVEEFDDKPLIVHGQRIVGIWHATSRFMKDVRDDIRHGVTEFEVKTEASGPDV